MFTLIFPGKFKDYRKDLLKYTVVIVVVTFITSRICNLIPDAGLGILIIKTLICTIVCNGLFLLFYHKSSVFKEVLHMGYKIIKH